MTVVLTQEAQCGGVPASACLVRATREPGPMDRREEVPVETPVLGFLRQPNLRDEPLVNDI